MDPGEEGPAAVATERRTPFVLFVRGGSEGEEGALAPFLKAPPEALVVVVPVEARRDAVVVRCCEAKSLAGAAAPPETTDDIANNPRERFV